MGAQDDDPDEPETQAGNPGSRGPFRPRRRREQQREQWSRGIEDAGEARGDPLLAPGQEEVWGDVGDYRHDAQVEP